MTLLTLSGYYLLAGLVFALAFFLKGYAVITPEARGASFFARVIWIPAAIMLWPYLLIRWVGRLFGGRS